MKELYFLIGVGIGVVAVFIINNHTIPSDDQGKVNELTKKIKEGREQLTKAVTDNTPKEVS